MSIVQNKIKHSILLSLLGCVISFTLVFSIGPNLFLSIGLLSLVAIILIIAYVTMLAKPIWLLYILCVFIPFSQSIPIGNNVYRSLNVGFDTAIIAVVLLGFITREVIQRRSIIIFDDVSRWLLIFWSWNLCVLILSVTCLTGAPLKDAIFVFLRWSQYIPVFFIVLNLKIPSSYVKKFVTLIIFTAVAMAMFIIWEYFIIGIDYEKTKGAGLVVKSLFIEAAQANYNIAGAYLAIVGLLYSPFVFTAHGPRKVAGVIILVFLLIAIFLTSSRSSLIAFICGSIFFGLFYFRRILVFFIFMVIPLAMVLASYYKGSRLVENIMKLKYIPRGLPILFGKDRALIGLPAIAEGGVHRLYTWSVSIKLFLKSPIWGNGFRSTRWSMGASEYFTAESYFLETLSDSGMIGLSCLIVFLWKIYMSAVKLYKLSDSVFLSKFSLGYQAAFIGFVIVNMAGGMFMSQKIWGLFILLSALVCNQLHRVMETSRVKNI